MRKLFLLVVAVFLAGAFVSPPADAHFYSHCKTAHCEWHVVKPFNSRLNAMASCESHQHWHIEGLYSGGLQFSDRSWHAAGGNTRRAGYASELEQKYRAVVWASMIGWRWHSTAGWPVCG